MKKQYPRDERHIPMWIATEANHVSLWMEQVGDEVWWKITDSLPPAGEYVLFRDTKMLNVKTSLASFRAFAIGGLREVVLDKGGTWRYIDYGGLAIDVKDIKSLLAYVEWMALPV